MPIESSKVESSAVYRTTRGKEIWPSRTGRQPARPSRFAALLPRHRSETLRRRCRRIHAYLQCRDIGLLLGGQVDDAGDLRHLALNLSRESVERGEIVAEDLDGDVGARPGEHVVDAVGNGLANRDVGSRQQRGLLSQLLEHCFARPVLHRQAHVDLRRFHALHVLVELGATSPPSGRGDLRHAQHQPLEGIAQRVRISEARARNRHGAHGQGAFVELREKRSARGNDARERNGQQSDGSGQNCPPSR